MDREGSSICPRCGTSLKEWNATRRLGCFQCLQIFEGAIQAYLGWRGRGGHQPLDLRHLLEQALEHEDFERAALLRDLMDPEHGLT